MKILNAKPRFAFVVVVITLMLVSCGREGAPKPPEFFAPSAVLSFNVKGHAGDISLSWLAPALDASGHKLYDLDSFVVKRRLSSKEGIAEDFEKLKEVSAKMSAQLISNKSTNTTAEYRYGYKDEDVLPGKVYEYMVQAVNGDGTEGPPSGIIKVTFVGESSAIERH